MLEEVCLVVEREPNSISGGLTGKTKERPGDLKRVVSLVLYFSFRSNVVRRRVLEYSER